MDKKQDTAARLAAIRRHHDQGTHCNPNSNDECWLLAEVERLSREVEQNAKAAEQWSDWYDKMRLQKIEVIQQLDSLKKSYEYIQKSSAEAIEEWRAKAEARG